MIHRGIATFGLDYGKCPKWLFERMVNLGRQMIFVMREEYGPDEFISRIADPAWFQSLGTVLAFDWNASGLTTILTAALKEAIKGHQKEFGIFIAGGKGKTSRKAPEEIRRWGDYLSLPESSVDNLVYNSKMAAKVDSALVQDGFQLYHHTFFLAVSKKQRPESVEGFSPSINSGLNDRLNIAWAVVQQGMNTERGTARRYHWYSQKITDLVNEPHSAIVSPLKTTTLNLTASASEKTRELSTELVRDNYFGLMKDIRILRKYSSGLSQSMAVKAGQQQLTFLNLENREFYTHPVVNEDFSRSRYLEKVLYKVSEVKPDNYEKLLSLPGVGPKTMRALSLVSEVIYGAKPSYEDPARYSFAHGGKDATPYPVDRPTYDSTIQFMSRMIQRLRISASEKRLMELRLKQGY